MAKNFYGAITLTGGAAGALDAIASAGLQEGDGAFTVTDSEGVYIHNYASTSASTENAPNIITPDDIAGGNGRWILKGMLLNDNTLINQVFGS